jgi:hypothetical protein
MGISSPSVDFLLFFNSVLFFVFGLLIVVTRPTRLTGAQKKALRQAEPILQHIFQHQSLDNKGAEVCIIEILRMANSAGLAEEDIFRLYDLVPAYLLPNKLGTEGPTLDWHSYDLCIVSAEPDLKLARRIGNSLRLHYPNLRVFVDDGLVIGPQAELFKRIYRAGSRLCLALVSVHLVHDQRRRHQLNEARQREKISRNRRTISSRSSAYLKPIAVDEPGLQFMKQQKDLAPFVEHVVVINDRDRLFTLVVNSILEEFKKILPYPPVPPTELDSQKIFISHSQLDDVFARPLYRDLEGRGIACWFAPENMLIGEKILDSIEAALRRYRRVLLILSEESIKSSWVEREVKMAFEMEKASGLTLLYPIKIDNAIDNASLEWVSDLHRQRNIGDFSNWGNPEAYKRALDRLVRALQSEKHLDAGSH